MWLKEGAPGLLLLFIIFGLIDVSGSVGVVIDTDSPGLPSASGIVSVLQSQGISQVRLLRPDHQLLSALANTGVEVIITIPNDNLLRIGISRIEAATWLTDNVAAFRPATNITYITVGSEVLTTIPNAALVLLPAFRFLESGLVAANLSREVKISTPHSMALIPNFFPPSAATFNSSWVPIMSGLLQFLKNTSSSFMINASPYDGYVRGKGIYPLDYALFQQQSNWLVDPNTGFAYGNLFDAMVDASYFAMRALNFTGIPITVTETGWPWLSNSTEPDATPENALMYNNNLILHVQSAAGTPAQKNASIGAYIYKLFDADGSQNQQFSGRRWGFIFPNGTAVYPLDFASAEAGNATSAGLTKVYCVARPGADLQALEAGLNWACGHGSADCNVIQPGQSCYSSDLAIIASYAYNAYFHKAHAVGGTCDFKDTAIITTVDPSFRSCIFMGTLVSNTSNGSGSGGGGGGNGSGSTSPWASGPAGQTGGSSKLQFSCAWTSLLVLMLVIMI
ncbi:glucan endo-1,3-beta-glucosidase 4-like [Wolffia australiana]